MARGPVLMSAGQGRAQNTIKLRNEYTRYVVDQQSQGMSFLPFNEWVETFHPHKKILKQ